VNLAFFQPKNIVKSCSNVAKEELKTLAVDANRWMRTAYIMRAEGGEGALL